MTATATKERPIIFSGPMVQAILAGRKTQTRRIIKPQPDSVWEKGFGPARYAGLPFWAIGGLRTSWIVDPNDDRAKPLPCPYGRVGERLWVRETWHPSNHVPLGEKADYLADTPGATGEGFFKWKTPIFMPRWASRLTLEIVGVRVERLQDISEADAIAEGIERLKSGRGYYDPTLGKGAVHLGGHCDTASEAYGLLWQSIHGTESWIANPWAWVVEFRKVDA